MIDAASIFELIFLGIIFALMGAFSVKPSFSHGVLDCDALVDKQGNEVSYYNNAVVSRCGSTHIMIPDSRRCARHWEMKCGVPVDGHPCGRDMNGTLSMKCKMHALMAGAIAPPTRFERVVIRLHGEYHGYEKPWALMK